MELIDVVWFSGERLIGVVIGEDEFTGEKKAYIVTGAGISAEQDSKHILDHGVPFTIPFKTGQLLKSIGALAPDLTTIQAKIWLNKLMSSPVLHGDKQLDVGLYEEIKAFLGKMAERK